MRIETGTEMLRYGPRHKKSGDREMPFWIENVRQLMDDWMADAAAVEDAQGHPSFWHISGHHKLDALPQDFNGDMSEMYPDAGPKRVPRLANWGPRGRPF